MRPELVEGFESGSLLIKDFRMHFVRGGSGPPVVIVHGGWDSWWAWRRIIPTLADRHTVILPALRGLAYSGKPAGGHDAANLGDDLHEFILALGYERVSLVGHDFGAMACYTFAAQHRDAVERFALFDMAIPGAGVLEEAIVPRPGGAYLWHMGFHSVPDIPELLIDGHLREYMQWFFAAAAAVPDAVGKETLDHYVDLYSQPGAMRAFLQYYRELWHSGEQVRRYKERKLTIPTMAYGGDASLGEMAVAGLAELAETVEGGSIPMCGHWVAEEQPDFVLRRLEEFLEP